MNIFEALRESHERQRTYAKALIRTSGDTPERVEAYKQLKSELQAHETAEAVSYTHLTLPTTPYV